MANIEKRVHGPYRVKVRLKGHTPPTATFQKLSDAKRWAQVTEATIREGRHFPTTEAKRHTLAELIDRYVATVLPQKRASTIPAQRQHFAYWRRCLGDYTLSAITPGMIAAHRDTLARNCQSSTARRYLAALSHAFTIAVKDWQWCEDNPTRKVTKPKEPRSRTRFLSDDERQRLLEACQAS
jgi:integrase